jgi:DNA-nicking Smr family endonuclease
VAKKREETKKPPAKVPEKLAQPFKSALSKIEIASPQKAQKPAKKTFAAMFDAKRGGPDAAPATAASATSTAAASNPNAPKALSKPRTAERSVADLEALHDAFAGVKPIGGEKKFRVMNLPAGAEKLSRGKMPSYIDVDADVRKRLGELVAGGLRFTIDKSEEDFVHGVRSDANEDAWVALTKESTFADETLDLHGLRANDAETALVRFVRSRHRRGARILKIVHGKGLHSETGQSVLRDVVIHALTELGAAPLVLAFATAHPKHGGSGVMFVKLGASF